VLARAGGSLADGALIEPGRCHGLPRSRRGTDRSFLHAEYPVPGTGVQQGCKGRRTSLQQGMEFSSFSAMAGARGTAEGCAGS